jgi:uncharacterized membrane protein YfcA
MNTIYILLIIGLIAGFLSGLIGIGGGVVIVPVLVYVLHMNQITAQGTTIFMFLLPIGALSVYNYYNAGHVDFKYASIMALTFIVGSYFGSKTAISVDAKLIKQVFGVFMVLVGIKMFLNK